VLPTADALALRWYSKMELAPGVFTRNEEEPPYWTMALSRQALRQVDLTGKRCLDVGAVDGFMSIVMKKLGADRVVSVDCLDWRKQIITSTAAHGVDIEYVPRVGSLNLIDRMIEVHKLADRGGDDFAFDVVLCSGVMYHVLSPLHLIGALRTLVRPGGLVFLETAVIQDHDHYMTFNHLGGGLYIYTYTDSWFVTPPLLDYLLRMFYFQPIDMVYRKQKVAGPYLVGRAAVVCRAIDHVLARPDESQLEQSTRNFEFSELCRIELDRLKQHTTIDYKPLLGSDCREHVEGREYLNLLTAAVKQEAMSIPYNLAVLHLSDEA
jgi:2-polyprenyl-3-methyl-5-hydroxy-6-metoxy-1,4-benzoquinol methylase